MRRLLALAAVTAVGITAILVARHTNPEIVRGATGGEASTPTDAGVPVLDNGPAPPLDPASGWINTAPLTSADLAGKVVLYDFWTFDCINCKNTLPWVKAWHARYAADGLVVASVHTPEFAYEAKPDNVAEAVRKYGITYPVALDPDKVIWRSFENHYWPAFYVYDRQGRYRHQHFGEGSYRETEDVLRALLGVAPDAPRAATPGDG